MSNRGVALILGAGPRVGAAVAESLARKGYSIAIASRSGTGSKTDKGYLSLQADFTKPDSVAPLFDAVKKEYKTAPSVVVYNAAGLTPPPDQNSVLSVSPANFASDLNLNVTSPYVAAQEAVKGFETLPKEVKKTFIFTGNILNTVVLPSPYMLTLGVGKAAAAYWVGVADANYSAQGYRFFYADERKEDGSLKGGALDGPAHGEFYAQLVDHEGNVPWDPTFVKGKGYVQFK